MNQDSVWFKYANIKNKFSFWLLYYRTEIEIFRISESNQTKPKFQKTRPNLKFQFCLDRVLNESRHPLEIIVTESLANL